MTRANPNLTNSKQNIKPRDTCTKVQTPQVTALVCTILPVGRTDAERTFRNVPLERAERTARGNKGYGANRNTNVQNAKTAITYHKTAVHR